MKTRKVAASDRSSSPSLQRDRRAERRAAEQAKQQHAGPEAEPESPTQPIRAAAAVSSGPQAATAPHSSPEGAKRPAGLTGSDSDDTRDEGPHKRSRGRPPGPGGPLGLALLQQPTPPVQQAPAGGQQAPAGGQEAPVAGQQPAASAQVSNIPLQHLPALPTTAANAPRLVFAQPLFAQPINSPPRQGNLSDAEHEAQQQRDAAALAAAQETNSTVRVDVHLYDPGELHGPMHLHLPMTATVAHLKREIERLSGVMPRYQQVDIREPNSTLHWTLPENDRTGQQACLSQFFKKGSSSFTVYCSFLPHTPDRPNSESNAAETLLAFQVTGSEQPEGENAQPPEQKAKKVKPKSPSHLRPNNAKAGAWTAEEIDKLITAMEKIPYGKWSRVQSEHHFHHRSQVDLKDKWRNLAHAVVYKKQTRRVWLTDEQKERIIRCLPQYNQEQLVPADQQAVVPPPDAQSADAAAAAAVPSPAAAPASAASPASIPEQLQSHTAAVATA